MTEYKAVFYDLNKDQYILKDEGNFRLEGFQHYEYFPKTTWLISHNKNTKKFIYQVFINDKVVPFIDLKIVDDNNIEINFTTPVLGFVNFLFYVKYNIE
jgi:hypothetical protein